MHAFLLQYQDELNRRFSLGMSWDVYRFHSQSDDVLQQNLYSQDSIFYAWMKLKEGCIYDFFLLEYNLKSKTLKNCIYDARSLHNAIMEGYNCLFYKN